MGTLCSGLFTISDLNTARPRLREAKPPPACERKEPVPGV